MKSDIWSLGCVIYEMLCLRPPFIGKDMSQLYKKICKGVYPSIPSHYSEDIKNIVALMLNTDPELRPSCDDLIKSPLFNFYAEKLNRLSNIDDTFQATLDHFANDW